MAKIYLLMLAAIDVAGSLIRKSDVKAYKRDAVTGQ
jgi:hypothetical protein